jgi:isopenicillin N synthase-like dioxygenase
MLMERNKIVFGIHVLERNRRYFRLEGIAQDALIMNIDDLLRRATDNILLSSTIGRNKNLITEVISAIINGTEELIKN